MSTIPAAEKLGIVVIDEGPRVVAHVVGEVDMATCGYFHDALEPHITSGRHLVVDLAAMTFMDSSCLHVLDRAHTALSATGGSLTIRNPTPVATRLLSLAGLSSLLDLEVGS